MTTAENCSSTTSMASRKHSLTGWWVVLMRELGALWVGGKALYLILAYAVFLGAMMLITTLNSELDYIPAKEMVFFALQTALHVGMFMGLVIGADSLSGERDRASLELLLLTPVSRRQIVTGKLLAGFSSWPAAWIITIPFLYVLAQGDEILGPAIFWGTLMGTVLALGFTGLGMLVSNWSQSNRTSYFLSLALFIFCFVPTQWPGSIQKGFVGKLVQRIDPMEANNEFLEKILVNHRTLHEFQSWLRSPFLFAFLVLAVLLLYAGPRLRLTSET